MYETILNLNENEYENFPQSKNSLSKYQNKTQFYRPFSKIFTVNSPEAIKTDELQLIEDVKNKMAKYKISIPIKRLNEGMLTPNFTSSSIK